MAEGTSTFEPVDSGQVPRFAGRATFMRLPAIDDPRAVDIALVGIPWDGGTTNRAGARHGPRQVRDLSTLIRRVHPVLGIEPFRLCRIADLGDAPANPIDLPRALETIEAFVAGIVAAGAAPLSIGGDHLCTLPILRAVGASRPLGLIQFDAHSDTNDSYFGGLRYTHGTPFRRAIEEGVLDPRRVVQIGLRGSLYAADERDWAVAQGIRTITIEEVEALGLDGTVAEARRVVGDAPTYLSFDIDAIDPAFAPGTGTPEFGGLLPREVTRLIRGLRGLDLHGADVVEVSPPFDPAGVTAMAAANVAFEILCILAEAVARRRG